MTQLFARASWSIDTAIQASEVDAHARPVALMTPQLASHVGAAAQSVPPTAQDRERKRHLVVSSVSIRRSSPFRPGHADLRGLPKGRQ